MDHNFLKAFKRSNKKQDFEIGSFDDYRISWNPSPESPEDTVRISYRGLLKNSGADSVYLHYAFDSWGAFPKTIMMNKVDGNFGTEIKVSGEHELNFCFKDSANNWDNNNGSNWTMHLR